MRTRKNAAGTPGQPPNPGPRTKSLKQMMLERPKDFDFSDIAPPTPTDAEKDSALMTLETAIGDYAPIEGHGGFYLKAMKLREQKAMLLFEQELRAAKSELESLESMERIAVKLIYRMEGENFRPATVDEIAESFSGEDLGVAFSRYGGLTKTGEATGK